MRSPAPFHNPEDPYEYYDYDYRIPDDLIHTLTGHTSSITDWLKPVPGKPLTFKTSSTLTAATIEMMPYYRVHRERYVMYWNLK